VCVSASNINFSDPVVSHLFSIFVKYFVNVLWKMAYRSDVSHTFFKNTSATVFSENNKILKV
jgi:hypothetical protein